MTENQGGASDINTPQLAIVDIVQLRALLEESKVINLHIEYNNGEPTIDYSFPNCSGDEFHDKVKQFFAITHALIEQAYVNMGIWQSKKGEDVAKKRERDIGVA